MKRNRNINISTVTAIIYLVGCCLLSAVLLLERPRTSSVEFEDNERPGMDRLFVPVLKEQADLLFTSLTGGGRKTASEQDGLFVVSHPSLGSILSRIHMGDGPWKELESTDAQFSLSSDGNEIRMSMGVDAETGEEFVRVPAGILSLFIK